MASLLSNQEIQAFGKDRVVNYLSEQGYKVKAVTQKHGMLHYNIFYVQELH